MRFGGYSKLTTVVRLLEGMDGLRWMSERDETWREINGEVLIYHVLHVSKSSRFLVRVSFATVTANIHLCKLLVCSAVFSRMSATSWVLNHSLHRFHVEVKFKINKGSVRTGLRVTQRIFAIEFHVSATIRWFAPPFRRNASPTFGEKRRFPEITSSTCKMLQIWNMSGAPLRCEITLIHNELISHFILVEL